MEKHCAVDADLDERERVSQVAEDVTALYLLPVGVFWHALLCRHTSWAQDAQLSCNVGGDKDFKQRGVLVEHCDGLCCCLDLGWYVLLESVKGHWGAEDRL